MSRLNTLHSAILAILHSSIIRYNSMKRKRTYPHRFKGDLSDTIQSDTRTIFFSDEHL